MRLETDSGKGITEDCEQDMAKADMKGASVFQGKAEGRSPSGNRKQVFLNNFIDCIIPPASIHFISN